MSFIKAKDLDKIISVNWTENFTKNDLIEGKIVTIEDVDDKNPIDYIIFSKDSYFVKNHFDVKEPVIITYCEQSIKKYTFHWLDDFTFTFPYRNDWEYISRISVNTIDVSTIKTAKDLKRILDLYNLKYIGKPK